MEAQFGGDKYVPDTEEVYWQRDPAESVEGERRQRPVSYTHLTLPTVLRV